MSFGIDIGSKTIKVIELEKDGQAWRLRGSGIVGYQGNPPEHANDEKDLADVASVVKKLYKEARISKRQAVIALPEAQVFTRVIRFPMLTDQEIASAVKWEAEQYIPIPIAEAVVQHEVIARNESTRPPQVSVLLVAAPETMVEKYLTVIETAGLTAQAVETELMSLVRALAPVNQTALILDMGAKSTDIAIAKNKKLLFSRSIPTAGDAFTRAVAQHLGVEYKQAEEYKKTYGLSSKMLEGKVKDALTPVVKMVSDEVKKSIHFFQTEEKGEAPKSVIVTGGSAGMPDLISVLTNDLQVEVMMGNPFTNCHLDQKTAQTLAGYAPLYSVAVGLAMRGG